MSEKLLAIGLRFATKEPEATKKHIEMKKAVNRRHQISVSRTIMKQLEEPHLFTVTGSKPIEPPRAHQTPFPTRHPHQPSTPLHLLLHPQNLHLPPHHAPKFPHLHPRPPRQPPQTLHRTRHVLPHRELGLRLLLR